MSQQIGSNSTLNTEDWRCSNIGLIPMLTYALNSEQFSDVTFTFLNAKGESTGVTLKAHRFMLALNSPVFQAMFNGPFIESKSFEEPIQISDVHSDVFKAMVEFMYTRKLPETEMSLEHIFEVMYAANKYCVFELQKVCSNEIVKRISDDNVIGIFQRAQLHLLSDQDLMEQAKTYIQNRFKHLFKCEEFLNFSHDNLCILLEDPNTCISPHHEFRLFTSLVKWSEAECRRRNLEISPSNKRQVLGKLRNLIQFTKMKPGNISREVYNSNILSKNEMMLLLRHLSISPDERSDLPQLPFIAISRRRGQEENITQSVVNNGGGTSQNRIRGAPGHVINYGGGSLRTRLEVMEMYSRFANPTPRSAP